MGPGLAAVPFPVLDMGTRPRPTRLVLPSVVAARNELVVARAAARRLTACRPAIGRGVEGLLALSLVIRAVTAAASVAELVRPLSYKIFRPNRQLALPKRQRNFALLIHL